MTRFGCGLRGSRQYCRVNAGACCADCLERKRCSIACANAPERCGYKRGAEVFKQQRGGEAEKIR